MMADIQATELRKGTAIVYEDSLYRVLDFEHRTPGNKRGFVQTKLRNVLDGTQREVKFSTNDSVERAVIETREMEHLYADGTSHVFMDTENYEQISIPGDVLGDTVLWLTEGVRVLVEMYADRAIGVRLPKGVEAVVADTEPVVKGQTASRSYKPARLENGVVIQVPPFIGAGDRIRVDAEESRYIERCK
jgi:elongation factor P